MAATTILLVDDDDVILHTLSKLLTHEGFEVTTAASVSEALRLISSDVYDVLLSDLHMPGAGDGLTVVSAMRHANPKAVTMLLSSFPEMEAAAHAILLQADDILVKPMELSALVKAITRRLSDGPSDPVTIETVATILERTAAECIDAWFKEVQADDKLSKMPLTRQQRTGHLPQVFRDLVACLNADQPLGCQRPPLSSGGRTRSDPTQGRLLRFHDGGRITHITGVYFPYAPEELGQYQLQHSAVSGDDDCGRGGLTTEAGNGLLC
jgi:DNA-binding response OmpR family regulator